MNPVNATLDAGYISHLKKTCKPRIDHLDRGPTLKHVRCVCVHTPHYTVDPGERHRNDCVFFLLKQLHHNKYVIPKQPSDREECGLRETKKKKKVN